MFPPLQGAEVRETITAESRRLFNAEGGRDLADHKHPTTRPQRNADALHNLVTGQSENGSKIGRSSIIVTIGVDRLLGEAGADPAVLLGSGPLPDEAVDELAKKADVLGQVFGGDGQPLWHSRRN